MAKLVSIALCTYNPGKYLSPLMDSLLGQTWEEIEIVCCDDRSTDSTIAVLEQYQSAYEGKIKIYKNEANLGYIKNFEKCLGLCSGDLIAIADHDDIWKPNKIEILVNAIGDAMMVYSDSVFIDENGNELPKKISDIFTLHDNPPAEAFLFYDFIWGHTTLLRKELLDYAFPIPADMPYDSWLAFTAASISRIRYVDETLTGWRQHAGSFSTVMAERNKGRRSMKGRAMIEFREKLQRLELFKVNQHAKDKVFIDELIKRFDAIEKGYSWPLFFFLLKHHKKLFPIWKRNYLSRLNEFRKMARKVSKK